MRRAEVAVVGAGIAGLAAALALARAGREVLVIERAETLGEVGAGLQMSPNAVRALDFLGVGEAVREAGSRPAEVLLRLHRGGEIAFRMPLGETVERRFGAPYLHLHRADLHGILLAAARVAGVEILLGEPVAGLERPGKWDGETARLRTDRHEIEADLLLGADGVRSILRAEVAGESAPRFSGNVAWRGLAPAEGLPEAVSGPRATVWMGLGKHLVVYPLRRGKSLNFVAVESRNAWTEENWSKPGDPRALREKFAGFAEPVQALLSRVSETYLWGLFSHAPLPRWSNGRTVLIGDAAHPTTPFLAQGAAMALEDAASLALSLSRGKTLPAWEASRKPRTTRLQRASLRTGRNYHAGSAPEQWLKATALRTLSLAAPSKAADLNAWIYAYDPTA